MTQHFTPRARGIVAVRADATGDPKVFAAEMKKAFEDFKAEHTGHLEDIRKGFDDVVKAEKVDRINATITELQNKIDEAQKTAKAAADAEARMDEIEKMASRLKSGGDGRSDRDLKAEAGIFLAGKAGVEAMDVDASKLEQYETYANTFASFLKRGDRLAEVQAAMQVGSDPDGGYWVPTQMANDIKKRLFETSAMRSVASELTITTDSVSFPTDTNDATSGGWVGETASRSTTATPQVGEQRIYVREQYAQPEVTQKLLDMATIDVESWLMGKIVDKMVRTENTAFVSGTGVNQPRGFLDYKSAAVTTDDASRDWGKLQYVVTGASGGFDSSNPTDAVLDIIAKLKPEYRNGARFVMNRAAEAEVRKLKDSDGRSLVGMGDIRDSATGFSLFGFPITTMEDMPNIAANSFSIAFGNFAVGYQIVDGRGVRILRDPYTNKPYVRFYTTKWTGGDVVNFDAIKLLKFGTS